MRFPSFKIRDYVRQLVFSITDGQALENWQLHTLEDMICIDNQQHHSIYWSPYIIKSLRWLLLQASNAEHLIFAHQCCLNRDTPPKHSYTEMHNADYW
jgi:hypothetical protein